MAIRLSAADRALLEDIVAEERFDDDDAGELDIRIWESICDASPDFDRPVRIAKEQALYFAAFWLESDMSGGGFHRFFKAHGPRVALLSKAFLLFCGPKPVLKLLDHALAAMPDGWLKSTFDMAADMLDVEDPVLIETLGVLDAEYHELELPRSFAECRLRFAARHPDVFFAE